MPRNPNLPQLIDNRYLELETGEQIKVGSDRWFAWLELKEATSFSYQGDECHFTARKEQKKNTFYWYAFRWLGKTRKFYIGASCTLTQQRLKEVAGVIKRQSTSQQDPPRRDVANVI